MRQKTTRCERNNCGATACHVLMKVKTGKAVRYSDGTADYRGTLPEAQNQPPQPGKAEKAGNALYDAGEGAPIRLRFRFAVAETATGSARRR